MPGNAARPPQKKKIGLALQGGGTHGAFTWGVLDRLLQDERFEIEGISGTSAGAMNAAALAQGLRQDGIEGARASLKEFWYLTSQKALGSPFQPSWLDRMIGGHGLNFSPGYAWSKFLGDHFSPYELNPLNINPLREVVEEFYDIDTLQKKTDPKLFLCATHVSTGKLKIFKGNEIKASSLLASACLPFVFQAVEVDGEAYWDGGFIGNPALFPLIYSCSTHDVILVHLTPPRQNQIPVTAREIIDRHKEITYNACLVREMRTINLISDLVDRGVINDKKIKSLYIHIIRNEDLFRSLQMSSALNADWDFLQMLFHEGRKTADIWLQENFDNIGVKTTADLHADFIA